MLSPSTTLYIQTKTYSEMKNIVLSLILLLCNPVANALTIDKLFNTYKNQPNYKYEVIKGKSLNSLIDSAPSELEKEVLQSIKKLIILEKISEDEQLIDLSANIEKLKDYSLAYSYSLDSSDLAIPLLSSTTSIDSSNNIKIYSKKSSSSEYLNQPLFFFNTGKRALLAYLDGKLNPETTKNLVRLTLNTYFSEAAPTTEKSPLDRINIQMNLYPQEKIHVVTDRDIYCGGDTIWLRAFIVDANSHIQTAMSKYAYIELLTPFGFANKRVKLMERNGVYAGYIPIDEDIYEGDYTLAAYTTYTENQGQDYFFRKPLKILAPQSSKYTIDSKFSPTKDGDVKGNFKIRALGNNPINYKVMSWTMPDGNTLEMAHAAKGISRKFNRNKRENIVLVKFGDYGKYFPVEFPSETIDITFYPEGGWLISDKPCTVAFKATDENGKGVNASGIIKNSKGEEVVEFNTIHKGMGTTTFIPENGETYTAFFTNPNGNSKSVEIGAPKEGATGLRYRDNGAKGTFSVAGGEGKDLELVVALRGAGMLAAPISASTPLSFDKDNMPEGLYQAFLVSKSDNEVLSERIFFLGASREANAVSELNSDSTAITLNIPQGFGADCSVRITNGNIAKYSSDNNLRTQLMLQSELRGRIENPAYYFINHDREAERNLDLLMMVNGWSRYNLPEAIQGKYEEPKIPLEIGQEISGQVRSRWNNKPMEGILINAIAPKMNFGTFAETDQDGRFYLNGFDFPEGTSYIFKAMNEKGGLEANYDIYDDNYPEIETLKNLPAETTEEISDYFKGTRWILLDEVNVQAFKESNDDVYANFASYSRTADDMKARGVTTLWQALKGLGGVSDHAGHLKWRNSELCFYIDGQLFDPRGNATMVYNVAGQPSPWKQHAIPDIIGGSAFYGPTMAEIETAVPFNSIERIDLVRPEHSKVLGPSYGGPAVVITTKKGDKVNWARQFELKDYLPLGYQKHKEYASPMLSVDTDEYDIQTHPTLLWLPSVKFDENGKSIDLKFPIKPDYKVIVEGISDNGDIIYEQY